MPSFSKFFRTSPSYIFVLSLVGISSWSLEAAARPGKAHAVGSGLVYPTLNHSPSVNPTALVDSPRVSLQAAYLIDPEDIHVSVTTGHGSVGFGATFRQDGNSSIEEAALGARFNIMTLAATMRTREFKGADADIAASFDFGSARMTLIGRGADNGFDRIDAGLGFLSGSLTFGIDVKKPLPVSDDVWLFDAGFSAHAGRISAGAGYSFALVGSDFIEGHIHAGLSLEMTSGLFVEAFYRPSEQEWSSGEWVVGLRTQL